MYIYKGKYYEKFKEVKMKNPLTREWQEAILYVNEEGEWFVREKREFNELFIDATKINLYGQRKDSVSY